MAGNMREVFIDTQASLDHINRMREKHGRFDAEMLPDVKPSWHIVTTMPGGEGAAAGHLIGRRFGLYQPQIKKTLVIRGRKQERTYSMFPGYLFVFVWDINRHARRIMACTGVKSIMSSEAVDQASPEGRCYVRVSDLVIDKIRAEENKQNPITFIYDGVLPRRKRRKNGKSVQVIPADAGEIVSVSAKSYWSGIETLDDDRRIGLLHRALGLAS